MAEIFQHCLPPSSTRLHTSLHRLPPLTLTYVCKYWRNLCLSLPRLWTDVVLGRNGSDPAEDSRILDLWISRSGHLPMSLEFFYEQNHAPQPILFDQDRYDRYVNGMRVLIDTAATCIHRWRSFEIHALDIVVLERLFVALVGGAPQLEHLGLSTSYLSFFGDIHVLDFSRCPSLRSVRLLTPIVCPVLQSAPMQNMKEMELRFCTSIEDCLQWLDACPVLERLTMRLGWVMPNTVHGRIRHLRRLTYLELHGFSTDSDLGPLLDVLDVPALKSFRVDMYDIVDVETRWTHVLDLVRRSSPPLESLKISGTPMLAEDIVECLRLLPCITELSLGQSHNADLLLRALSVPRSTTAEEHEEKGLLGGQRRSSLLCPSLKVLDLANSSWSLDALAAMVSSRCSYVQESGLPGTSDDSLDSEDDGQLINLLEELCIDVASAPCAVSHPNIAECIRRGLGIVEREPDVIFGAFTSPNLVFE